MFWILVGYMWLFIHRPFEVWESLAPFRLELGYILFAGLVWAVAEKRWMPNLLHWAFFLFAGAVVLCWQASPYATDDIKVTNYLKLFPFYLFLVTVVKDERWFRRVLLAFLVVMSVYMLHSLREYRCGRYYFRMGIERMIGVDGTMNDPNSFGATIVYALPLVVPFWRASPSKKLRAFLLGYGALSLVCIGLTGSRSAFVGLLLWLLLLGLREGLRKWVVLGPLLGLVLWLALPAALQDRFLTIVDPSRGPENAERSADLRKENFVRGMKLWAKHPVLGVGNGAWRSATDTRLEAHNMYGELMGEMGTLGILTFGFVVAMFWINQRRTAADYCQHPEWGHDFLFYVNQALGTVLILLLFEGNFSHNLLRYTWLWFGGFLIIARYCVEQRLRDTAPGTLLETPESQPVLVSAEEV